MNEDDKKDMVAEFLAADGRGRRALLQVLRPHLTGPDLERMAPALRDATPKIAARLVALLARHGMRAAFEAQLGVMKPGKAALLRGQFARMARAHDAPPSNLASLNGEGP